MRIGIEASRLKDKGRGIERHISELIKAIGNVDKNSEYFLFSNNAQLIEDFILPENFKVEKLSNRFRMIRRRGVSWLGRIFFRDLDLFHFPNSDIWFSKYCKTIVTIHDLAPLHFSKNFFISKKSLKLYFRCLRYIKENADYILTVSEYSKRDIIEKLNFPADRVIRIYNGIGREFCKLDAGKLRVKKEKLHLPEKFILFVGGFDFRKNIEILMRAFKLASKNNGIKEHKLLIVGNSPVVGNSFYQSLLSISDGLSIEKDIIFLHDINNDDLVTIYNSASLFVFPSIFEGFGFPPLEAMACGCPVICSKNSSLPEVVGDAAIMFEPQNIELLADLINEVLKSSQLHSELSAKGLKRVVLFSWENAARQTLAVYQRLAV